MPATNKMLRALKPIATSYDFEFDGLTARGHFRWLHRPTGRLVVSVRSGSYHAIKNTERDFRKQARTIMETTNG